MATRHSPHVALFILFSEPSPVPNHTAVKLVQSYSFLPDAGGTTPISPHPSPAPSGYAAALILHHFPHRPRPPRPPLAMSEVSSSSAQSSSSQTFLTALVTNLAILGVELVAFVVLKRKLIVRE